MVKIPNLRSTYQKYGQYTRNMVKVPEIWSKYQKYCQHTRNMINIPEIWSTYQKYCHHTRSTVNIPEIWSTYQKFGQHTRNKKESGAQSIHELDASRKSCRPPWRFWAGGEDCTDQSEKVIDSRELQAVCEQLGGEKRRKKPSTAWKTIRNCGGTGGPGGCPSRAGTIPEEADSC